MLWLPADLQTSEGVPIGTSLISPFATLLAPLILKFEELSVLVLFDNGKIGYYENDPWLMTSHVSFLYTLNLQMSQVFC